MQLVVAPTPRPVTSAPAVFDPVHLAAALTAASNVAGAPTVNTLANLTDGVNAAKAAVANLQLVFDGSSRGDAIIGDVVKGRELLGQAVSVLVNDASADGSAISHVQQLAADAVSSFRNARFLLYSA